MDESGKQYLADAAKAVFEHVPPTVLAHLIVFLHQKAGVIKTEADDILMPLAMEAGIDRAGTRGMVELIIAYGDTDTVDWEKL